MMRTAAAAAQARGEFNPGPSMLRERAESGRLVLVDIRRDGPRSWRGRLASDKFHPNDHGYAELATIVERAVERAGLLTRP